MSISVNSFQFMYDDRPFDMMTKLKEEAELWVTCLNFMADFKSREEQEQGLCITGSDTYFHTLKNTLTLQK